MAEIQRQLERATGRASAPERPPANVVAPPPDKTRPVSAKAPSREGKVHIGAYLHPDFKASLRLVQAQTGKDMQALIAQALNELFRAHNVPVVDQS
jgi:hypothetical protein